MSGFRASSYNAKVSVDADVSKLIGKKERLIDRLSQVKIE